MKKILLGMLVLMLLVGLVAPAFSAPGVWKTQTENETGVPTDGTTTLTSGQVTFGWTENKTINVTDAYNVSINTAGGAISSWDNKSSNLTVTHTIYGGTGTYYISVWACNESGHTTGYGANWSTHPLNITGYIIDPRGTTPSIPAIMVAPVAALFGIVLYVVYRRRK